MSGTSLIERVRKANISPPPEESVTFRVVTTVAVLTGILACEAVGELSWLSAGIATVAVAVGMVFSYVSRHHPHQWLKVLLAIAVVVVFVEFVSQILSAARTGELASIEVPLAGLFTWVQVIHAYDVPARRDLLFSLAAAVALVTVASAQAVSQGFLVFVLVLLVSGLVGLACSWRSMAADVRGLPLPLLAGCLAVVVAVALGLVTILPAPHATQELSLPASLSSFLPLSGNGITNGNANDPSEPAKAGLPGGKIGVGGYVGFAGPLDVADRNSLGNQVIMRVRADSPGYFLGMTYDTWNGQSWLQSKGDLATTRLTGGSPFQIPLPPLAGQHITENVQTFYVEQPLPNLLFATSQPAEVYFPASSLILGKDGSIRSTVAMTPGTVYTIVSADDEVSPALLATDRRPLTRSVLATSQIKDALQLPHRYPRVGALVNRIVRQHHAVTTVAKVEALEQWMGSHTQYTTDIPPLGPGQDAVDEFLFGNREGYCEQISTALAVMLRTLGIPAREAIGYVPGPFDPLSDLYDIEANDAHAWVQVYFPHYGWQNFDPTAQVPLAPQSPGSVIAKDAWRQVVKLPWPPIGSVAGAGMAGYGAVSFERRRRRRPKSWAAKAALRLEHLGARAGLRRTPAETLSEYAARIEQSQPSLGIGRAAEILEANAYAPDDDAPAEAPPETRAFVGRALDSLAGQLSRLRIHRQGSGPSGPPRIP